MRITVLAVGGTFDKVYYDALSDYRIGEPQITEMLKRVQAGFDYAVEAVIGKDSLDMTDEDRQTLCARAAGDANRRIVVIHGTDTMVETARALESVRGKVIVVTGSMQPARFRDTDAHFNAGFAVAAVQLLGDGAYVAMNGRVFKPSEVVKNRAAGRFERASRT